MSDSEKRAQRVSLLRVEFEKLLQFHAESFREIDAKAKYWLTACLSAFLGLMGYGFQNAEILSIYFVVVFAAVNTSLLIAIYFFASTLGVKMVLSGVLLPGTRKFKDIEYFLENDKHWAELEVDQTQQILDSIASNERLNAAKSLSVRYAEISLFRGVPGSACLAAVGTFLYTAACPSWLAAATIVRSSATTGAAVVAGAVIGAGFSGALIVVRHYRDPK
ncbi:hypothetical protein ACFFUT_09170 [Pseudohalocynthiibacter aestuariivivens]|uniref:Uncharacterized protein n=1 Tax=Pseudohalocynthiibacter aestuariivivens TaxID=1591409 RepID=A0ABV5JF03_9RHOB|nr:hypothetical protein [Pseudohalocynthiibacter aestuariivivens]MBS9718503.1 hypothetical protein [Pseudohalocynthiibacter aestuariivivens]